VKSLERSIDQMESVLKPLHSFVIPGGLVVSSQCQISRTICRRAERQIIRVSEELFVPVTVIQYINRLSDYLFVLARWLGKINNAEETIWKPRP